MKDESRANLDIERERGDRARGGPISPPLGPRSSEEDDAVRRARERAAFLLEGAPAPMSSALLAREIFGFAGGSDAACAALLTPVLAGDRRFEFLRDEHDAQASGTGTWRLSEAPEPYVASTPPRSWCWAVWSAAAGARAAAVVRLESGRTVEERFEAAGAVPVSIGCGAPDVRIVEDDRDPSTPGEQRIDLRASSDAADLFAQEHDGGDGGDPAWRPEHSPDDPRSGRTADCGTLDLLAIERLTATARGAIWVSVEPASVFGSLHHRLRESAPDRLDQRVFGLTRLAVAALGPPRPRGLIEVATRLGHRVVESEQPLERARLAAECLLLLLDHSALRDARGPADLELRLRPPVFAPPLEGRGFDAARLRELPGKPGIYRFYDRDGDLLYVGKARNLRARVGSYFAARRSPDPRTESWLSRVHRFEIELSGSELEAILREADLIVRTVPLHNVQRTVHERGRAPSGHVVLLLPAPRGRSVRAYLIEDGRLAARILLGPRGAGRARLRSLLEATYFTVGTGSRSARRPRLSGNPQALISSWLRRQAGVVPAFDPTDAAGPEEAFDLAIRYAESLRRGEWDVVHR